MNVGGDVSLEHLVLAGYDHEAEDGHHIQVYEGQNKMHEPLEPEDGSSN